MFEPFFVELCVSCVTFLILPMHFRIRTISKQPLVKVACTDSFILKFYSFYLFINLLEVFEVEVDILPSLKA